MRDPVAVRLVEIRDRKALTIKAMADAMGVDPGQLYRALYKKTRGGIGRKMLDGAIRAFPEIAEVYAQSLTIRLDDVDQEQHLGETDEGRAEDVPLTCEVA